jgi:hypothetical protein
MQIEMTPNRASTVAITCNTTAQNLALPAGGGLLLSVLNAGANIAFMDFTADANFVCAAPTANGGGGMALAVNVPTKVHLPAEATRMAMVSLGNSTIYVARGKTM